MDWEPHAKALADDVVHPLSRWHRPLAATPRHLFTPRWWRRIDGEWTLRDGAADPARWMSAAYGNRTLVTRIGDLHADHAKERDHPTGLPTSSSTLPGLVVTLYQRAMLTTGLTALCVTGTGYGTALLAARLGDGRVTHLDIDPYLVRTAHERLKAIGVNPRHFLGDITGPLQGHYDRIISTVAVPTVPKSWLYALNPGGRLVTTLAGTGLLVVADSTPDGGATGQVTLDRAGFMAARPGDSNDYASWGVPADAWDREGETVTTGRYPVIQVPESWELYSAMGLAVPGIRHAYTEGHDGLRTAVMDHTDGSWARATGRRGEQPIVHQGGPQRLWSILDQIRHEWMSDGQVPVYGATVRIEPDGTMRFSRGSWVLTRLPETPGL